MARGTFVMRDGKLVPKALAKPLDSHRRGPVSSLPRPYYNSDSIGGITGLVNPSDGKFYTSKAKMRAENRARGLTEVGNEAFPVRREPTQAEVAREIAAEVADAYDAIEAGAYVAPTKEVPADTIREDLVKVPDGSV
jgi:hypothetical protein